MATIFVNGCEVRKGWLDRSAQERLAEDIRLVIARAPLFAPMTRWGKPMRVRMTSAGRYGWFSDRRGYRYIDRHPNGTAWPPIPATVREVWRACVSDERMPDCCLINRYGPDARLGLHQDKDEADFGWPVLSLSLGDSALFRVGGPARTDPTESIWLDSGDVAILGGNARLAHHGIDRIKAGSSTLLADGGRINLTCRVVD